MNNSVLLVGTVTKGPIYTHSYKGKDFYEIELSVRRQSGSYDIIPVTVPTSIVENLPSLGDQSTLPGIFVAER